MTDSYILHTKRKCAKNCVIYSQSQSLQKVEYLLLSITFIYIICSCVVQFTLPLRFPLSVKSCKLY